MEPAGNGVAVILAMYDWFDTTGMKSRGRVYMRQKGNGRRALIGVGGRNRSQHCAIIG